MHKKLAIIQQALNVPKSQYNDYGKFNYRNIEDILEGLKPLLKEQNCTLVMNDTIEQIGSRWYVKATVTLISLDENKGVESSYISNSAYAREASDKKGMEEAQITGAASSYARKYAISGLFLIDGNKDSDSFPPPSTPTYLQTTNKVANAQHKGQNKSLSQISQNQIKLIEELGEKHNLVDYIQQRLEDNGYKEIKDLNIDSARIFIASLLKKIDTITKIKS